MLMRDLLKKAHVILRRIICLRGTGSENNDSLEE